ncbi:MAG: murein L,D-transpeptidase [Micromonosporaceae bacterium]|nr:murein L,D-transpeptidase [Micromonosporaceae bacterium]
MRRIGSLVVVAAAIVVGAGACAFEPQRDEAGLQQAHAAEATAGASAAPGPSRSPAASPPARSPSPSPTRFREAAKPKAKPSPSRTGCPQGEHQRDVERYLAQLGGFGPVTVDGRQSDADCAAIKKFQRRYGISPAAGRAGPTTVDVARRLASTRTDQCKTGPGTTFCLNLTLQTVWAIRDGKVVMKPTVVRTGKPGYATPTGTYHIGWRNLREWSDPYEVWMPYWQQFTGGIGFHETPSYLHNKSIGSHGCVNLLHADAVRLWELGKVGTRVYVFGRRPGT